MKYNKLKAFTLAEVMVLLLTLTILLAAFAPIFTRRYVNTANDDVWTYVPRGNSSEDTKDIYYDSVDRNYKAQAFIGLTPKDATDVNAKTTYSESVAPYTERAAHPLLSKLVIAATGEKINGTLQNQIQFRAGTNNGSVLGSLFAGNGNMLVGGPYKNIERSANGNTAYGSGALKSLTTGYSNTAVGYSAFAKDKKGYYNTAIGYNAGAELSKDGTNDISYANVLVGNDVGNNINSGIFYNNTLVGYKVGYSTNQNTNFGYNNTAVGYKAMYDPPNHHYTCNNTAVGNSTFVISKGLGNVALGYNALYNTKGYFNTAVGAYAGYLNDNTKETNYKTFIGYNSGNGIAQELVYGNSKNIERVFIGTSPKERVGATGVAPGAVLEVHNIKSKNDKLKPMPGEGDSSVVINGNLIVRGNTYLEAPIVRQGSIADFYAKPVVEFGEDKDDYIRYNFNPNKAYPKGLILFKLFNYIHNEFSENQPDYDLSYTPRSTMKIFGGFDGIQRSGYAYEQCGSHSNRQENDKHAYKSVRPNCICTAVRLNGGFDQDGSPKFQKTTQNGYDLIWLRPGFGDKYQDLYASNSYDWYSKTNPKYSFNSPTYQWNTAMALKVPITTNGVFSPRDYFYVGKNDGSYQGYNYQLAGDDDLLVLYNEGNERREQSLGVCGYYANCERGGSCDSTNRHSMGSYYSPYLKYYNSVDGRYPGSTGANGQRPIGCTLYEDKSSGQPVILERRNTHTPYLGTPYYGTDFSYAHLNYPKTWVRDIDEEIDGVGYYDSCCPVLIDEGFKNQKIKESNLYDLGNIEDEDHITKYGLKRGIPFNGCSQPDCGNPSDRRLKNVGEQFTAGLDEIKKLNVYNYTFKNDKNKIPQVGVIAQDLRLIFPNAVTQDEKGYYKIRWDEMFYAAINAIKTLNAKIESFIVKVDNDKQRIAQLKKDNNEMNNKLDELSKELTRLEKLAARKNNK